MTRWILVLSSLVLPSLTLAAPADSTRAGRANSLRDGAWALQLDIEGQIISVDAFSGGVSLKRDRLEDEEWFFNAGGVRFGLSVYF